MSKAFQLISLIFVLTGIIGCHFGGKKFTPIQFPEFPWPPQKASAFTTLSDEFFRNSDEGIVLLRDVDNRLSKALRYAGYAEKSYYAVPDGFALVSRLEQINPDGTPKLDLDRWTIDVRPLRKFSLSSYLRALFTSQPGYYRVIVFVVTRHSFYQDNVEVSPDEVKSWIYKGLNRLPDSVGMQRYTLEYTCTALIYELKKEQGKDAATIIPGNLSAETHLEKSVIMSGLRQ
jgi:hypothetical protein